MRAERPACGPNQGPRVARGALIHYSDGPLGGVKLTAQCPEGHRWYKHQKPNGLWVSALGRDDWPSWCRSEDFRKTRRQSATLVTLRPPARILRITGANDLDLFTLNYGEDYDWSNGRYPPDKLIRWDRVAADWQGIVIAPYVWERRLHASSGWYYGWDCASGCIWDPAAVESLVPLRAARPLEKP